VEDWEEEPEDEGNELQDGDADASDDDSDVSDAETDSALDPDQDAIDDSDNEPVQTMTGDTCIRVYEDPELNNQPSFKILGGSKFADTTTWMTEVVVFLIALQNLVKDYIPTKDLSIKTMHKRGSDRFRGHPNFRGIGPWKDWAMVDWGGYGKLPVHIWCFVDLGELRSDAPSMDFGGIPIKKGIYAVVEATDFDTDREQIRKSDLFLPIIKEVGAMDADGAVLERKFYLADVDAITRTCCAVPNIGGPTNSYFLVKPRSEWHQEFVCWLEKPHSDDKMDFSDEEAAAEEEEVESEDDS